jgi:hypothetical protein
MNGTFYHDAKIHTLSSVTFKLLNSKTADLNIRINCKETSEREAGKWKTESKGKKI